VAVVAAVVLAGATVLPDRALSRSLRALEAYREGMADEARTAFYRPAPAVGAEGDTFDVIMRPMATSLLVPFGRAELPSYLGGVATDGEAAPAPESPSVVWVRPPVRLVLATGGASNAQDPAIPVRPGDVVVVGEPTRAPSAPADRRTLALNDLRGDRPAVQLEPGPYSPEDGVIARTLLHIPVGIAYVLWSPFPFDIRRAADILAMPEMLVWYAALPAAAWTLATRRRRLRRALPVLAFVAVLLATFVAAEGNTGILFRHRAMVIPYVLMFAAPGFMAFASILATRLARGQGRARRT